MRMRREPEDDYFHAPDDDPNFNESRYYSFYDPAPGLGGWVRMGNRPNEGYARDDGVPVPARRARRLHVQATAHRRPPRSRRRRPPLRGARAVRGAPRHATTARSACSPTRARWPIPAARSRTTPTTPCTIDLTVTAVAQPSGGEPEWDEGEEPPPGFVPCLRRGHTEQQMAITGMVRSRRAELRPHRRLRSARPLVGAAGLAEHLVVPLDHRQLRPGRHRLHAARCARLRRTRTVSGFVSDVERYGDTRVVPVREMTLTSEYDDEWFVVRNHVVVDDRRPHLRARTATSGPASRCATVGTAR